MTQDSLMIVQLTVRERDGAYYITSPNLVGVNVFGEDVESTYQSVVKVVKALYQHNFNYDVEVWPGTTNGQDFPKLMHLCDSLVVRLKAA